MTERWKDEILQIIGGANALKESAMNRYDTRFPDWHRRARDCIRDLAPKKLPSFDEIRFASDFFLSRPESSQAEINDRIALISDLDLCIEMMHQILEAAEEAQRKADARSQTGAPGADPARPARREAPPLIGDLRGMVAGLDLSARDREEVLAEIERVERALAKPQPDWDQVKRVIRFLLDFDRVLAVEAIPLILARIPKS